MTKNGREAMPGDRGDKTQAEGVAKLKSGNCGNLKAHLSKGYDSAPSGWGGKVRR